MWPDWTRTDSLVGLAFAAAAFLSRALLRVPSFVSMDAGLLAIGSRDYAFDAYQPHPPYYPVSIALARILMQVASIDGFQAFAWLAAGASALCVAGTFALARTLGDRWTAAFAALILLASPLALRNGVVPLSYALEGAAAVAVAALALACRRRPEVGRAVALGFVTSLAIGLRPSALVLVAPLALWGTWRRWPAFGTAIAAGALATAAWLGLALAFGGGWASFAAGLRDQSRLFVLADPVWHSGLAGVASRARWLAWHLRHEMGVLAGSTVLALVTALPLRDAAATPHGRERIGLLAAWLLPGVAFYALVYAGWPVYSDGYLMALMPGLALACALALRAVVRVVLASGAPRPAQAIALLVVGAFALQPVAWPRHWDGALADARAAQDWEASWDGFEAAFPANETAMVTFYDGTWVRLRHPDHVVWVVDVFARGDRLHSQVTQAKGLAVDEPYFDNVRDGDDDAPHPVPPWVRRIVVVDGHPQEPTLPLLVAGLDLHKTTLVGGRDVTWIDAHDVAHIEDVLAYVQAGPIPYEPRTWPPQ